MSWLDDNPPARPQFRTGRREPIRPVIVVHTAESGTDLEGADEKAENVAEFIRTRDEAGSYHLLGDADGFIDLIDMANEAFHDGSGSNPWSIGISLAMNAKDWPDLTPQRRDEFVHTAARMAVYAARRLEGWQIAPPRPRRLTKADSEALTASGFIGHGDRQDNRTDPGEFFPWSEFFAEYTRMLTTGVIPFPTHEPEYTDEYTDEHIRAWQKEIRVTPDGKFGPDTLRKSRDVRAVAAAGRMIYQGLQAMRVTLGRDE